MAYISSDGSIGGKKTWWKQINDFLSSILMTLSLFFTTVSNPRQIGQIRSNNPNRQYGGQRTTSSSTSGGSGGPQQRRGANIRGVKDLGSNVTAAVSG